MQFAYHRLTQCRAFTSIKTIVMIIFLIMVLSTCNNIPKSNKLVVHFMDVGQADSILIQSPSLNILIDAGNNADGNQVISYLKRAGVHKLDYIIGTHPHEDHIGGMDQVINSFSIGNIILPNASHTTRTYQDVLDAIPAKGLKIQKAVSGTVYKNGDITMTVLAPNKANYKDLNNIHRCKTKLQKSCIYIPRRCRNGVGKRNNSEWVRYYCKYY